VVQLGVAGRVLAKLGRPSLEKKAFNKSAHSPQHLVAYNLPQKERDPPFFFSSIYTTTTTTTSEKG
jgi:hypothetical protein